MVKKLVVTLALILLFATGCSNEQNGQNDSSLPGDITDSNQNDNPTDIPDNQNEDNGNNEYNENNKDNQTENNTLFHEFDDEAAKMLVTLTLEEKIGQMFLVRCPLEEELNSFMALKPGGFIMFGKDFKDKTKQEVISNISSYQSKSQIPMIIGVDEEGGTVVRISSNPQLSDERFKSPQEIYNIGGYDEIINDTYKKSKLLKELGINLNLAPVADVSTNKNDFIYERSFGKSAQETSKYVKAVVNTMNESRISSTLKHFPGYGNNVDTHTGSAYDSRPYESFISSDFLPFIAGIESGSQSILVSHNVVASMDENLPASLSKKVHDILRNELNFTGIIMTDDMSMAAVQNLENVTSPEVLAIEAGNDIIIVTDFKSSYNSLITAVKSNEISMEKINESVLRILKWKYYMGII